MKTVKYELIVEVLDDVMVDMEISKKQYDVTLKNAKNIQAEKSDDDDYSIKVDVELYDDHVVTTTQINNACTHTILIEYRCKKGYCFSK